jgi:hypothetical protein
LTKLLQNNWKYFYTIAALLNIFDPTALKCPDSVRIICFLVLPYAIRAPIISAATANFRYSFISSDTSVAPHALDMFPLTSTPVTVD